MNIATSNFKEIFKILSQSTFLDRVVPFRFDIDHRKQIIVTTKFRNGFKSVPPKIKIRRNVVSLNKNTYEEIDYIISVIDQETSMSKSRANNYVVLALKSIALFEGRNKVELCDVKLFKDLFLKHITTREVRTKMVDVMLHYLSLNPNGSMEGFIEYLEGPESKTMYPLENELFLKDGLQKAKYAWSKAVEIKNRDKGIREVIEGIKDLKEEDINVI
jgi:MoxR-like ATPase